MLFGDLGVGVWVFVVDGFGDVAGGEVPGESLDGVGYIYKGVKEALFVVDERDGETGNLGVGYVFANGDVV